MSLVMELSPCEQKRTESEVQLHAERNQGQDALGLKATAVGTSRHDKRPPELKLTSLICFLRDLQSQREQTGSRLQLLDIRAMLQDLNCTCYRQLQGQPRTNCRICTQHTMSDGWEEVWVIVSLLELNNQNSAIFSNFDLVMCQKPRIQAGLHPVVPTLCNVESTDGHELQNMFTSRKDVIIHMHDFDIHVDSIYCMHIFALHSLCFGVVPLILSYILKHEGHRSA